MKRRICPFFPLLFLVVAAPAFGQNIQCGLRVPAGFEVVEFADSKLANDIFHLSLDPKGRVVVSGAGYLRLLLDEKGTGKATRAVDVVADIKQGAQGVLWEGDTLFYISDGGLRCCRVVNDKAGPSELIYAVKTGGEHEGHAVKRGPDGWLYLLCGNFAKYQDKPPRLKTSPVKRAVVAGSVLRFSPDLKQHEVVADGYRNAYDMDWNLDGELFTYDSDNERDVSLPWYEPTRFYHVIPGGHYGWQAPQHATFWKKPSYFPDVVAPLITLGRGSPTGVACYRHVQFPEKYRGGFFLADWTFGRIYFVKLTRSGSTYKAEKEIFLEAMGDEGFAPTAMAVHPITGDLYVSIGGRGTRGAVYRVRHTEGAAKIDQAALAKMKLPKKSLEWKPEEKDRLLKQAKARSKPERLEALIGILRHRGNFTEKERMDAVRAQIGLLDKAILRTVLDLVDVPFSKTEALDLCKRLLTPKAQPDTGRLHAVRILQIAFGDIGSPKVKGMVWEGYTLRQAPNQAVQPEALKPAERAEALKACRGGFPIGSVPIDREISRTLAMLEDDDPGVFAKVAAKLTDKSPAVEDVHYLIVLSRLKAPRTEPLTKRIAGALLDLDRKVTEEKSSRDTYWPLRIGELHAELAKKDANLNAAMLAHPNFGRPDHALFAQTRGFDQRKAAEIFLSRAAKQDSFAWNAALVELIGVLPPEKSFPVLRHLWGEAGLEPQILLVLAKQPEATDRDKFLFGLNSPQSQTVGQCVEALEKLPGGSDENHLLALIQALRRLGDSKEEKQLRESLGNYLQKLTGQKLGTDKKAWVEWFAKGHPKLAARLAGPDGVDVQTWAKRLARIDWPSGDAARGSAIFTRASCASCHSGARALGPDLRGVTGRFSRDDLLTAILQPSKDISPRYRTTQVETAEGRVYQGLVIYEAVGSLILQTGPAATVRVVDKQIVGRRLTDVSLMPAGLLDPLKDQEIADLLAYLKSLGNTAPNR